MRTIFAFFMTIFIIVLFIFCGWKLFSYYQKVEAETQSKQKVEAGADIRPDELPGLPGGLYGSLQAAQKNGGAQLAALLEQGRQRRQCGRAYLAIDG